jgi:predicted nucleotidyltransferase
MDVFDKELINFWTALNNSGVKYIMVGSVASILHGHNRLTEDMDVWIEDTIENRRALRNAFKECGMGDFFMMERLQIVPGWTYFHLNNGIRLDLITYVKGLEEFGFEECLQNASTAEMFGVEVPFLNLNHLLQAKKAANRPKDQLDIDYLERVQWLKSNDEAEEKQ